MGLTKGTAPPYDPMFHNGMMGAPYSLYGLFPTHTWDLIHQTYLDSTDFAIVNEEYCDQYFNQNKYVQKIKNVRDSLTAEDSSFNIRSGIIIPVNTDSKAPEDLIGMRYYLQVEAQNFLIELRSGKGFDNIGGISYDNGSKGVLISHMINCYRSEFDPSNPTTPMKQYTNYSSILDIESASPYPEGYREPAFCYSVDSLNGTYYDGKDVNDWMDDVVSSHYDCEGGQTAFSGAPMHASLPSDFFNDSDRNKFTPATRPALKSFKQVDLHMGIYIDNISDDYEYADITVYRNYWSLPLTEEYLAVYNEGKSVVGLHDYCYFGDNFSVDPGIQIWLGNGTEEMKATLVPGTDMVMKENSFLMLANNTMLRLEDSKLTFLSGSKYQPNDVAEIELEDSELNFNDGFVFCPLGVENLNRFDINVSGNSSIYNSDLELINNSLLIIRENSELVLKKGTNLRIPSGASLILEDNASLIIERGANLTIDPDAVLQFGEGAEVSLKWGSSFVMDGAINYGIGIYAEYGSSIYIRNSVFTNTGTGVRGTPSKCVIQNSTFEGCRAGVSIEGCDYMEITDNTFTGIDVGVGLSLTQSYGYILRNTIENFDKGIMVVSCSPLISNNIIKNNRYSGVYSVGLNSIPQLITTEKNAVLNNIISNNGQAAEGQISLSAQISVLQGSDIFMKHGWNNVFSNPINQQPEIPCLLAFKLVPEGVEDRIQLLYVQGNYWGSNMVNNDYFLTSAGYGVIYEPYSSSPFGELPLTTFYPEQDTKSYDLLIKAIEAELEGKYDKSLKIYEKIIEKYPENEEATVAYAKLSDSYTMEGLETFALIDTYNLLASTEDETVNRKFFKEMIVYSNLKSKRYDEAINVSQEMKNEAETEEEQILCDIDIVLANILKNGKSKVNGRRELDGFLSRLSGSSKDEPAGLESVILPEKSTLYQNYPNPFNPVTQIKFDLAKAGMVKLSVYNISGQKVAELTDGVMNAGRHSVEFDGSSLNSGVYYYTIETDGMTLSKRMLLMK